MTTADVPEATAELEQFRSRLRAWLAATMAPAGSGTPRLRGGAHLSEADVTEGRRLQRLLFEGGWAGLTWPVRYGGQGLTPAHQRIFDEESSDFVMPDLGIAGLTTLRVCGPTVVAHGSEEFCLEHVPRMLAGDEIWVQLFSEHGAGSDLAAVTTRAVQEHGTWRLSGSKTWTSGAYYADYGLCLTRTDWEVPKHRGLTWFAVPLRAPGVTVTPIKEINGGAEFCEEFLDDVRVPDGDRIGPVNDGWNVARTMMTFERVAGDPDAEPRRSVRELAPDLVALARDADRLADPAVRQLIARAHVNDVVLDELTDWLAAVQRAGVEDPSFSSYGKLAAGTFNPIRARIGLDVAGPRGIAWDPADGPALGVATDYLNARVLSIAGGTNEMQRNGISERVLGLPREPANDHERPFSEVVRAAARPTGEGST